MPSWVKQQLADVAGLLGETPERAKMEFQRLAVGFMLYPVRDEGAPFLRAVGSGDFEQLAFSQYLPFPTTGASNPHFRIGLRGDSDLLPQPNHGWTRTDHLTLLDVGHGALSIEEGCVQCSLRA